MKKSIFSVIIFQFLFLLIQNVLYAEKRGKDVVVKNLDGSIVSGELIAVKQDSLLLLEKNSGRDVLIKVSNLHSIKVIRRIKPIKGMLFGLISGIVIGGVYGAMNPGDAEPLCVYIGAGAAICSPFGFVAGLLASGLIATDSTYLFKGRPEYFKDDLLRKLRKHARIKDAN